MSDGSPIRPVSPLVPVLLFVVFLALIVLLVYVIRRVVLRVALSHRAVRARPPDESEEARQKTIRETGWDPKKRA